MAASTVSLSSTGTTVDFSTATLYGTNAATTTNTVTALRVGNTSQDGQLIYSGPSEEFSILRDTVLNHPSNNVFGVRSPTYAFTGYVLYDLNMSGTMIFSGPNENASILRDNILNHPANNTFGVRSPTYVLEEQLP
jgi:hypothetical protein